jgi:hypothetical protein
MRVVAEAALAARRVDDLAVPQPVGDHRLRIVGVAHQHQRAVVVGAAVGVPGELARPAARCSRRRPAAVEVGGIARRAHAGRAAQRRHADAGVVGDRRQPGVRARMARLGERVLDEGANGSSASPTPSADCGRSSMPERREQRLHLAQLAGVAGGEHHPRAAPRRVRQLRRRAERLPLRCASRPMPASRGRAARRPGARERRALGGALHLDDAARAGHHHVHVGVAVGVLGVVEVEHRLAAPHADRHRGDRSRAAATRRACRGAQPLDRIVHRDPGAGDRGGAGAAVGLQHVAVDLQRALAERLQVDHRAQAAADQPLDLLGAPRLLAARRLAVVRVWVARGSMPYSAVSQPCPLPAGTAAPCPRRWRCTARACRRTRPAPSPRRAGEAAGQADSGRSASGARRASVGSSVLARHRASPQVIAIRLRLSPCSPPRNSAWSIRWRTASSSV